MDNRYIYRNPTIAFEMNYHYINAYGHRIAGTKASYNRSFTIQNPLEREIKTAARKFNSEYADYEWQWYLTGNRDASEISEKAKIWKNMFVEGTTEVNSNYGYFWNKNNQLDRVIEELKINPDTRRAIIVHYDLNELDRYKFDTPCNNVLNFYIHEDHLHLTIFARSIDLWFGFCNDQYCFSRLMELVSEKTGYPVGEMHWHITNFHIYERHYNKM